MAEGQRSPSLPLESELMGMRGHLGCASTAAVPTDMPSKRELAAESQPRMRCAEGAARQRRAQLADRAGKSAGRHISDG